METNQVKLLASLAKKIKSERKERAKVIASLLVCQNLNKKRKLHWSLQSFKKSC
ncbi:hypothetical protein HNP25_003415 [Arcicella rosea]|uniref:Uncharacterized protein n=1 Tax=Arcicella rosea TaxID=502909 RepID=A0A841END6_9BACT|nr:hypothetical protein [Arcicella rosea]